MSSVLLSKFSPDHIFSPDTDREIERVQREAALIRQRDRLPLEDDRSPIEEPIRDEPENDFDIMLDGLLEALQRRIQND